MVNIYQVLQRDHQKIKGLFDHIIKCGDRNDWDDVYDLFCTLKSEMVSHSKAEEETFHSLIKDENNEPDPLNWECKEEHHVIALLLLNLGAAPEQSQDWLDQFKHLYKNVCKHIDGEERKVFAKARKQFSDEQCDEIGLNMLNMKESLRLKTEEILHAEQQIIPLLLIEK